MTLEPCSDAVSRQAVLDINEHHHGQMPNHVNHEIWEEIKALPSVTPQQKMGHWKAFTHSAYRGNDEDGEPIWREVTVYHCDLCNRRTVIKEKYCPKCGCKMQEVKE